MEVGILEQKQWIITGILVVIAVVIALSFSSLTGKATSKLTNTLLPLNSEITLTPTSLKAGEEVIATLKPGRSSVGCLDMALEFYQLKDDGTLGLRTATKDISNYLGTKKNCDTIIVTNYKTGTNWKGNYAVVIGDRTTGKKVISNKVVVA